MNAPSAVQWAVTGLCNYRCRHCFVGDVKDELSFSDLQTLTDRLAEGGVRKVYLTGGEPLLRPDLKELLRVFSQCGIRVAELATNGSLLTEKTLRDLTETGHRPEIAVSFDGTDGCHDRLRNAAGAEEAAFRAMDISREHRFSVAALMTLHRDNLFSLRPSLRKLYAHGCGTVKVKPVLPLGRAGSEKAEVASPEIPEMYEAFLDAISGYYAGEYPMKLRLGGFFAADPEWKGRTSPMAQFSGKEDIGNCRVCQHAASFPFLDAGGRLLPCAGLAALEDWVRRAPSLLEMTLAGAMASPFFREFCETTVSARLEANAKCAACESARECGGGCRMNALAFGGGLNGCDSLCCEFFLRGWREKIPGAIRRGMLEKFLSTGG